MNKAEMADPELALTCRIMVKALVVADSAWVVNDIEASLSIGEWDLAFEEEPRSILDHVAAHKPDVVIVDLQISSMGGMAVIREMRDMIEPGERPKTVLLLDRAADEFLARRAGADACVLKPFTAQALREAINELDLPAEISGGGPRKGRPKR